MAKKIRDKNLEVVYSSPLKRAKATADVVAKENNIKVIVNDNLKEGCFGEAEGLRKHEVWEQFAEACSRWYDCDDIDYCFAGGETKRQIMDRFWNVLNEVVKSKYKRIGIATHGAMIRFLVRGFGVYIDNIDNGQVFHLVYENGNWELV